MKRCGFVFLALLVFSWSGMPSIDDRVARGRASASGQDWPASAKSAPSSAGVRLFRTIHADVVAIDQPYMVNRLGASQPDGMIFVLKGDLVPKDGTKPLGYSNFKLREGKRPRPLVLRMNVGDLLEIQFENWLLSLANPSQDPDAKKTQDLAKSAPFNQLTRYAGIHVSGLELVPQKMDNSVESIKKDGSWVGRNATGLLPPRSTANPGEESITYRLFARESGTFLMTSGADTTVHQLDAGLFGAVNVQPRGAEWYRSQTTQCEMLAATLSVEHLGPGQTLDVTPPPTPKLAPSQEMPESNLATPQAGSGPPKLSTLRTVKSAVRTAVYTEVQIKDKRVYSAQDLPWINYYAVFAEADRASCPTAVPGKPVLSMLSAIVDANAPKLTRTLPPGNDYTAEIENLDIGFIPFILRELFKEEPLKINLASDATVARAPSSNRLSWIVTNPGGKALQLGTDVITGKTYLVQGNKNDRTVTIQECHLHLVHSDLTAIITGPHAGDFPYSQDTPDFFSNPASPERRQPYREFTIIYHQGGNTVQAFPQWSNKNLTGMINAGMDAFGINYGIAAIGPEIVANRLGVGPMGNSQQPVGPSGPNMAPKANQCNDAVELKYEEFFLSSWCVGDPAMIVNVPANAPNQMVSNADLGSKIVGTVERDPVSFNNFQPLQKSPRPTKAFYPDDPSNVYHSYLRDHTKMRILHAGPGPAHVHHLHAHQWLKSPNSPDATYLDSQLILPGSTFTLEMTYHGSGNRNLTAGDSIFHCHFYPHFAKGMWSLWRVHDTFEPGTELDKNGVAVTGKPNRALPDGEIVAGTPTPALIPLPTLAMAPMPAPVQLTDLSPWYEKGKGQGRRVHVVPKNWKEILNKFDKDKNGELNEEERAAWYKAIKYAEEANKKNNLKYGDPGYQWVWYALYDNPGYPFFIPGVSGHRPPHPPLSTAWKELPESKSDAKAGEKVDNRRIATWSDEDIREQLKLKPEEAAVKAEKVQYLNGGLPRHLVLGGDIVTQYNTRWDFSKDFVKIVKEIDSDGKPKTTHIGGLYAFQLPEEGTPLEKAAMKAHSTRTHSSILPKTGQKGNFTMNGLPPTPGAPYADPSVTDDGNSSGDARRYQAAVIQTDVVLNKKGWHYPQSRLIALWDDVKATISNERAPEPFFIRTATNDATVLWHTNLVPNYYELDDFQVRTPTDVIGQHIHLVKFDVTSSDGGANGWNYEDGTFGPTEVRDRIHAIMNAGGLFAFDPRTGYVDKAKQKKLAVWKIKDAYPRRDGVKDDFGLFGQPPPGQDWDGAMTTIKRWAIDPLLNWQGHDRTLRTVFTHDHFGPSTHQQVGLYAGVLVEPQGSQWYLPDGTPMNTRPDGGPTSWQAMIVTADPKDSHREYAIEFQDMHLAYTADSTVGPLGSNARFNPLLSADAILRLKKQIPDYEGAKDDGAPAAFYIGQTSKAEEDSVSGLISALQSTPDGNPVPPDIQPLFQNYGIPVDKATKVYNLAKGDPITSYRAQWLLVTPAKDANGPLVNGGDYYILEATNPLTGTLPSVQTVSKSRAISVYTPQIPPGFADPAHAVNPNPGDNGNNAQKGDSGNLGTPRGGPQGEKVSNANFGNGAPYAALVSTRANGTYSMNYRNEPVQLRVNNGKAEQDDLANVFRSMRRDKSEDLNVQPTPKTPISKGSSYVFPPYLISPCVPGGPQGTDPFTPLIRGYVGDNIQIRALVGAHLQPHAFSVHGVHWLAQPSYLNSGYRNVQSMGISEHFEMDFVMPSAIAPRTATPIPDGGDYFYSASTGAVGLSNGLWGIVRSYNRVVGTPPDPGKTSDNYLKPLVNNPLAKIPKPISFENEFNKAKQAKAPVREFKVHAVALAQTPAQSLIYNSRVAAFQDKNAVIFVQEEDLPKLQQPNARLDPLILRACAGDWIKVTLINDFPSDQTVMPFNNPFCFRYGNPFNDLPRLPGDAPGVPQPNVGEVTLKISQQIGLHAQLVAFDVTKANGINVGFNPSSTKGPGEKIDYYWYAGKIMQKDGEIVTTPVEFGATNLVGADLLLQTQFGLVGALVIEPQNATWTEDKQSRAFANIKNPKGDLLFRECVLVLQNMVANKTPGREDSANQVGNREDGFGAVNYRTESFAARGPIPPVAADVGFAQVFSNELKFPSSVNGPPSKQPVEIGEPQTPIFEVVAGTPTRFRVVMPSTTSANSAAQPPVFTIHGHGWQDEPYVKKSKRIGHNDMSQHIGAQEVTVSQKYDIVIDSAGGAFRVPGDYLYQAFNQEQKMGIWGLFRVTSAAGK